MSGSDPSHPRNERQAWRGDSLESDGDGAGAVPEDARLIGLPEPPPRPAAAAAAEPQQIIDWSAVPEVQLLTAAAAEQARIETEARRWEDARKILRTLGLVAALGVALIAGVELLQRVFNAQPSAARLAATAAGVAEQLLRRHHTPAQPLGIAGTEAVLLSSDGALRARYRLIVTLRLNEALYASADSNGAQAYLDLQGGVAEAHARVLRDRLYRRDDALTTPPLLPALIALTHRAGERLVFEVPVDATRGWWGWRLEARAPLARRTTPPFAGEILAHQPVAHLVFGRADTREPMRALQREARDYILAVQRAARAGPRGAGRETPE